jgi:hypothetical protein
MNHSRKTSKQQRAGTAYIEALSVSLMFALVLGYTIRLGRSYHAGILSAQHARMASWLHAAQRSASAVDPLRLAPRALQPSSQEAAITSLRRALHALFEPQPGSSRR